jgi:hypothetical protein
MEEGRERNEGGKDTLTDRKCSAVQYVTVQYGTCAVNKLDRRPLPTKIKEKSYIRINQNY